MRVLLLILIGAWVFLILWALVVIRGIMTNRKRIEDQEAERGNGYHEN